MVSSFGATPLDLDRLQRVLVFVEERIAEDTDCIRVSLKALHDQIVVSPPASTKGPSVRMRLADFFHAVFFQRLRSPGKSRSLPSMTSSTKASRVHGGGRRAEHV